MEKIEKEIRKMVVNLLCAKCGSSGCRMYFLPQRPLCYKAEKEIQQFLRANHIKSEEG